VAAPWAEIEPRDDGAASLLPARPKTRSRPGPVGGMPDCGWYRLPPSGSTGRSPVSPSGDPEPDGRGHGDAFQSAQHHGRRRVPAATRKPGDYRRKLCI